MKRLAKKMLAVLLAAFVCMAPAGFLFGCAPSDDYVPENEKKYESRPYTVTVCLTAAGYGEQWLRDVAIYYMENYNDDTYIKVIPSVMNEEEGSKVSSGLATRDLYFVEYPFDAEDPLVDLSDIVKGYPTNETEHTIEQKMGDLKESYISEDGKYYQMPFGGAGTYAYTYAYNKTTLDEAFGAGNWTLPRTTKEFFEMGDDLKEKNIYLAAASYGDQTAYTSRGILVWFAQVAGLEAYNNFMNGKYWNGSAWVLAEDSPRMLEQQKDAVKAMYNMVMTLARTDNNYFHKDSLAMTFANVESAFSGHGFGLNSRKVAFLFNGPWLDNEVKYLTDAMQDEGKPQELGWMKVPISSDIVGAKDVNGNLRLSTVTDETRLRQAISYIDGDITEKPEWLSEKDVSVLTEARNMYPTLISGSAVIPENSSNVERAKDFLKFIASDEAMVASADSLNGLNMLPYTAFGDPVVPDTDNYWTKTYSENIDDIIRIDSNLRTFGSENFALKTGFRPYDSDYIEYNILTTAPSSVKTPDQYYESLYTYYSGRWGSIMGTWNS